MLKRNLFVGLGWLVSFVFLYFALQGLSWSSVLEAFAKVSLLTPILMVGVYCLGFILRSWRWKFLLPRGVPIGTPSHEIYTRSGLARSYPLQWG